MSLENLHLRSALKIAELVNSRELTANEVLNYFTKRAESVNPKINAFLCLTTELAKRQADLLDEKISAGQRFPLAGVPIGIKDNICVKGVQTTCASKILENFVAPYEATVTERLWEAGALCLGKTNLDEFAMGSSTEHSAFGVTRNPWSLNRVPGGSSGGSAAAVSARLVPLALGSDTGGSIRLPASFCGIHGMKPSYGRVSRFGLVAFASSLDQIGPFATTVEDLNLVLSVISGYDSKDSTSSFQEDSSFQTLQNVDLGKLKIGLVKELLLPQGAANDDLVQAINQGVDFFRQAGAQITEVSMPLSAEYALDTYYIIAPAEASSNLSRYDGVRYGTRKSAAAEDLISMYSQTRHDGFGREVTRRIIIGTYALSAGYYDAYYKKAQQVRRLICEEYAHVFSEVDLLLTPVSPVSPFCFGEKMDDPLSMYLCDIQTIPVNLAGLPALSVNTGFDKDGLPVGLQFVAPYGSDHRLLEIAATFEKAKPEFSQLPALAK